MKVRLISILSVFSFVACSTVSHDVEECHRPSYWAFPPKGQSFVVNSSAGPVMEKIYDDGTLGPAHSVAWANYVGSRITIIDGFAAKSSKEKYIGQTMSCGQLIRFYEWTEGSSFGINVLYSGETRAGQSYIVSTHESWEDSLILKGLFKHAYQSK